MGEKIKCGHCGATFSDVESAQAHADVCDAQHGTNPVGSTTGPIHQCGKCGAVFSNAAAAHDHWKTCPG
jgi:predicted  nucleic acid-binding Zn-ribbon protein